VLDLGLPLEGLVEAAGVGGHLGDGHRLDVGRFRDRHRLPVDLAAALGVEVRRDGVRQHREVRVDPGGPEERIALPRRVIEGGR
jgi:hypothetical protein